MIIQSKEAQAKTSLIDLLGGNTKSSTTKSNDLFSKLLTSFGMQAKGVEANVTTANEFKTVIDPKNVPASTSVKNSEIKSSVLKELQSLLGGSDEKESALISKELVGTLSTDQVRTLINRAKEYLKNEITAKAPEYQTEAKSLPKTLLGLVQLAEKLGLEPQNISLSTLISDEKEFSNVTPEFLTKPLLDTKTLASLPMETLKEAPIEAITQLLSELKGKEQKNTKATTGESLGTTEGKEKGESQPLKALLDTITKTEPLETPSINNNTKTQPNSAKNESIVSSATTVAMVATIPETEKKEHYSAPLTLKTEGLIALLQGANESSDAKSEGSSTLKIESDTTKTMHAPKADSIEVKSKEAQQSMRLFASDLKEAVQEYKPPFTRLTMKLNPEKLGEVEVTLVQRGNNVHVNIQSNNTTSVAFLAHNATELKAQLASQGITNATMNFMSGGENQQQQNNAQHQNNQEQRQNAIRSYESFEDLELSDEQITALEIIIPHYA